MPFSMRSLEFLFENRLQDSKLWFEEHKEEYRRHLLEPLTALAAELGPTMLDIDPQFVTEPRVDKTICRIRRDTRFSHDKSLYRDHLWIIFKRNRMHDWELPGMWFEIGCYGFSYGCGLYHASSGFMNTLREQVLAEGPLFRAAQEARFANPQFVMEGDLYKRPHYPDHPQELRDWLERRGIGFTAEQNDLDLLFSPQALLEHLRPQMQALAPIYHFLLETAHLEMFRTAQPNNDLM